MNHIHKIPYSTVVREKERTLGGHADPNSELAMEIARAVRDRLNNQVYMNDRGHKHRIPRVDPALDQRTTPYGKPHQWEEVEP